MISCSSPHDFLRRTGQLVALVVCLLAFASETALAQAPQKVPQPGAVKPDPASPCASSDPTESKRIFGIVPNYRTSPCLQNYKPLATREKFKIASQDAFDRGTVVLALAFAGESQLTDSEPSFGQGVAGYARYFGTSYADFVIGDYMTEAVFPSVLRQDPRYFRRGRGTTAHRLGYAVGQLFWTHNDSGSTGFNFSEVLGNSTAVAISQSYYPDNRDAKDASIRLISQLGVDAASNALKEFWPDLLKKFSRK
jgi:hypothetical protein